MSEQPREGGLDAPTRHAVDWKDPAFTDTEKFNAEAARVFDICHGCRRCVSLCDSFPTLFDLIDESEDFEVDSVSTDDYQKVVDQCYLCDLCYQTKCPYVPPHEWAVDYPKLMLRGKAIHFQREGASFRDRILSSPDTVGALATIPVVNQVVNFANNNAGMRRVLEQVLGVHVDARVPHYDQNHLRKRLSGHQPGRQDAAEAGPTRGKVALFATCYGTYNKPEMGEDLVRVFEHNRIAVKLLKSEKCCGMPKLELGDIASVEKLIDYNLPILQEAINDGWDIVSPIPSCVLMYKQELPLLFADRDDVKLVAQHIFDPFEYLAHRHKAGLMNTEFKHEGNRLAYQVACHQRVQNIGPKTREILALIPGIEIQMIERCSGHDGTYAVKTETHEKSMKIVRPVVNAVRKFDPDEYTSDCPMAASHIAHAKGDAYNPPHPISILRKAYGV